MEQKRKVLDHDNCIRCNGSGAEQAFSWETCDRGPGYKKCTWCKGTGKRAATTPAEKGLALVVGTWSAPKI